MAAGRRPRGLRARRVTPRESRRPGGRCTPCLQMGTSKSIRIGFRMHTGWAMLVAVSGDNVLRRCRVELYPARGRFVYHEAAELELPEAVELIAAVRAIVQENARAALGSAIEGLKVS